jgi:cell division control protein 6
VTTQPQQFKATLYALVSLDKSKQPKILTGDLYSTYQDICRKTGLRPLTQRRVSDIIAEFDMLGIINAKVVSNGRYGRTREISPAIPESIEPKIKEIIAKDLGL